MYAARVIARTSPLKLEGMSCVRVMGRIKLFFLCIACLLGGVTGIKNWVIFNGEIEIIQLTNLTFQELRVKQYFLSFWFKYTNSPTTKFGFPMTPKFLSSFRMVLVLNGVLQEECPPDTRTLYHTHPVYRETAAQLLAIPNKVIGPIGLLYVLQREMAATVPHDSK